MSRQITVCRLQSQPQFHKLKINHQENKDYLRKTLDLKAQFVSIIVHLVMLCNVFILSGRYNFGKINALLLLHRATQLAYCQPEYRLQETVPDVCRSIQVMTDRASFNNLFIYRYHFRCTGALFINTSSILHFLKNLISLRKMLLNG